MCKFTLVTARKRSVGQGNIFAPVCHSVHRGVCLSAYWDSRPPGADPPRVGTPQEQTPPPPGADTPLRTDTPPGADPLGADTPQEQTLPRSTPSRNRHPPGAATPREQTPPPAQCMLGDTVNKQAVRILLECILVLILCLLFI